MFKRCFNMLSDLEISLLNFYQQTGVQDLKRFVSYFYVISSKQNKKLVGV